MCYKLLSILSSGSCATAAVAWGVPFIGSVALGPMQWPWSCPMRAHFLFRQPAQRPQYCSRGLQYWEWGCIAVSHIWWLSPYMVIARQPVQRPQYCSRGLQYWVSFLSGATLPGVIPGVYHHNNLSLSYHNTPPNKAKPKINTQVSVLSGNFCSSKSYCAKWSTMIFKVFYGWIILHFNFNLSSCISMV